MKWVRRLLLIGLSVAVMVVGWRFASENQQLVSVNYLAGRSSEVALWKALVASFAAGALLVLVFALYSSIRSWLAKRRYRRALGGLEAEVHQLRNLPLAPDSEPAGERAAAAAAPFPRSSPGRNA